MSRVSVADFVDRFAGRSLDLSSVPPEPRSRLADEGTPISRIARLDHFEKDRRLRGEGEVRGLFDKPRSLPFGARACEVTSTNANGTPTCAGRVHGRSDILSGRGHEPNDCAAPSGADIETPHSSASFTLSGSVGQGGRNALTDVRRVQERLRALGYGVEVDGQAGPGTTRALRLFAAASLGVERVGNAPGRVQPGDRLHRAMASEDAPCWMEMPAEGPGFVNGDQDHHDHGSSRLVDVVRSAGHRYLTDFLSSHPGAPRITTNDVSRRLGGDTPDHATHENGLDLDLRLPRRGGGVGTQVGSADYDREATFAMVRAFLVDDRVERVFFSDPVLFARVRRELPSVAAKLRDGGPSHRNHFHVDVAPAAIA